MIQASLFTGIGGFDLAAEWMGWTNLFQCEKDEWCLKLLSQNFPNTVKHGDIKTTDFSIYRGRVDVLTGGFPCQPYSTAGKRLGKDDERHLWPEMLRAIREIQPPWIVGENVRGLTNWNGGLVFDEVQADLEAEGYQVTPFLLPAAGVNAPHRRDRVWFIAHSNSSTDGISIQQRGQDAAGHTNFIRESQERSASDPSCIFGNRGQGVESGQGVNNREDIGRQEKADVNQRLYQTGIAPNAHGIRFQGIYQKRRALQTADTNTWNKFPTQSGVCRGNDGVPNRVDRIKGLGNAVVPQVVLQIFKAIEAYEQQK